MDLGILEDRVCEIKKAVRELQEEIRRVREAGADSFSQTSDVRNSRQLEIAKRMRAARDAMAPLGISVKDLVEEGRGR